jgi:hypothetical protein
MTRLFAAFFAILLTFAPVVHAEEPADSIQAVIESQIQAFQRSDVDSAFTHASPTIQQKFGDPKTFGRMVEMGYPMVWRPRSYRMTEIVQTDSGPVQLVVFEDATGRLHEAGYLMQEIDGVWRINGVHVRALPSVGT